MEISYEQAETMAVCALCQNRLKPEQVKKILESATAPVPLLDLASSGALQLVREER